MSDDVPVAGPPRGVTPVEPTSDDWDVSQRHWLIYFGLVAVVVAVFVAVVNPDRQRWLGLGLLAAMVLWFVVLGRRCVGDSRQSGRSWLFLAGQLVLFAAGLAVADAVSLLLFALCPMTYMVVRVTWAHVVVAGYAFTPAVVALVRQGPESLLITVPVGVVATTISVVIAVTTVRTERVSHERAELIRELQATRAEVARLSHEAGIAEERQRLAGDIHDTVAQGLSSVVMLLEAADAALDRDQATAREHLRLATRTARENLAETRAIVAALTPAPLHGTPLADALRRLVDRFAAQTGTRASVSTVGEGRLATGVEVVLLRVVQEALHNVGKHARATSVEVEFAVLDDVARGQVRDDGVGFDPAAVNGGYGLGGMRARVEQVGGTLTISSAPGQGTTIRTEVPV